MSRYDLINSHKKLFDKEIDLEKIIRQFENLFEETKYLSLQRYESSHDIFTAREINGVIVAGNSTYLEKVEPEESSALSTDADVVSFDRLWVFKDFEKLKNYLRILLNGWMNEDVSTGNVEDEADFLKSLCFWDNTDFYRTGYKGHCSWNDTMEDYTIGYRKPKELMEKLTGETFEEWSKAANE